MGALRIIIQVLSVGGCRRLLVIGINPVSFVCIIPCRINVLGCHPDPEPGKQVQAHPQAPFHPPYFQTKAFLYQFRRSRLPGPHSEDS